MANMIGSPYSAGTATGQAILDAGKSYFGDTLTPALKRAQMAEANAKTEGLNFTNRSNSSLQDIIASSPNFQDVVNNPVARSFLVGTDNFDPKKMGELNQLATATNTANPILGGNNAISRAILGAGGSMANTPMGFEQTDQTKRRGDDLTYSASRENNTDNIGQKMYEFQNKPYEAMQGTAPVIIPQSRAISGDYQPYVKPTQGMTTTLPDGTVISMGGSGKPTEQTNKMAGIASEMAPGAAILNQVYNSETPISLSNGALVANSLPNSPLLTQVAQGTGLVNPTDQSILGAANDMANYLYVKTGAARNKEEDYREIVRLLPLSTDTPENRAAKQAVLNQRIEAVIRTVPNPVTQQEMRQAMTGFFQSPAGGAPLTLPKPSVPDIRSAAEPLAQSGQQQPPRSAPPQATNQPPAQTAGGMVGDIQEGRTAVNPQTGQRMIFQNGAWQPL